MDDVVAGRMLIAQVLLVETGDFLLHAGEPITIVARIAYALVAILLFVPFAIRQRAAVIFHIARRKVLFVRLCFH